MSRKKRHVRTVEEQLEDAKARVEELERKKAMATLKGTEAGKEIAVLVKARKILNERKETKLVDGIDRVIAEITQQEEDEEAANE